MLIRDVGPGIHWLEHAGVNLYLVEDNNGVMIVDSGLPAVWPHLRSALRELGYQQDSIRALVLTHAHFDHLGTAARIRSRLRAPILVHREDEYIAAHPYRYDHENSRLLYPVKHPKSIPYLTRMALAGALNVRGVTDVHYLREGHCTDLPGSPEVIHVPGHTAGHTALNFSDRGVLICGDALVTLNPYTGITGPAIVSGAATADSGKALESLEKLAGVDADIMLTGHGEPWRASPADAVAIARRNGPS
ncbi:MBL fold metallo-hydrolase [Arthrobacter sp. Sr33]